MEAVQARSPAVLGKVLQPLRAWSSREPLPALGEQREAKDGKGVESEATAYGTPSHRSKAPDFDLLLFKRKVGEAGKLRVSQTEA